MRKSAILFLGCAAALCAGTAYAAPEPKVEKRSVTISPRKHRAGDTVTIHYSRMIQSGFDAEKSRRLNFIASTPDARFVVEVAEVDSAACVKRLLISGQSKRTRYDRRPPSQGERPPGHPFKEVFVKGQDTPKEAIGTRGLDAATALFDSGLHDLGGLRGTLKPGQRVKLSKAFWDQIDQGHGSTERAVTYLGTDKAGLGILKVNYSLTKDGAPDDGMTTVWGFRGQIVFDPKGPTLRSVVLDADVELILPEGVDVKNLGKGKIRYTLERSARGK